MFFEGVGHWVGIKGPVLKKESPIIRRSTFSCRKAFLQLRLCNTFFEGVNATEHIQISEGRTGDLARQREKIFFPEFCFFPCPKKNNETHPALIKRMIRGLELEVYELIVRKSPQKGDNKHETRKADSMDGGGGSL